MYDWPSSKQDGQEEEVRNTGPGKELSKVLGEHMEEEVLDVPPGWIGDRITHELGFEKSVGF
jgi:hypothetical protein